MFILFAYKDIYAIYYCKSTKLWINCCFNVSAINIYEPLFTSSAFGFFMANKPSKKASEGISQDIDSPIEQVVSMRLVTLITLVTIFVSIASYFYPPMDINL